MIVHHQVLKIDTALRTGVDLFVKLSDQLSRQRRVLLAQQPLECLEGQAVLKVKQTQLLVYFEQGHFELTR